MPFYFLFSKSTASVSKLFSCHQYESYSGYAKDITRVFLLVRMIALLKTLSWGSLVSVLIIWMISMVQLSQIDETMPFESFMAKGLTLSISHAAPLNETTTHFQVIRPPLHLYSTLELVHELCVSFSTANESAGGNPPPQTGEESSKYALVFPQDSSNHCIATFFDSSLRKAIIAFCLSSCGCVTILFISFVRMVLHNQSSTVQLIETMVQISLTKIVTWVVLLTLQSLFAVEDVLWRPINIVFAVWSAISIGYEIVLLKRLSQQKLTEHLKVDPSSSIYNP